MKRLTLAIMAMAAIASCSKESSMDVAITSQIPMEFTTYAGSATTKGNPVDTNTEFKGTGNQFKVAAYFAETTPDKYFDFSAVKYDLTTTKWVNQSGMYWPNEDGTLYFGAYYPSNDTKITNATYQYASTAHELKFDYTVADDVADQRDVMYAVTSSSYTAPTDADAVSKVDPINLHFKHALTQIAFTATSDADITVKVSSLKICNVSNTGTFTATDDTDDDTQTDETIAAVNVDTDNFGTWSVATKATTNVQNYTAALVASIATTEISKTSTSPTPLTNASDAFMFIPQTLTAWEPTATSSSTNAYLAIACTITHLDSTVPIISGTVYVPFDTDDILYDSSKSAEDGWKPGYKITYNLHFGGGYITPGATDPEAGKTPTGAIETLRAITYTTSVDAWIPVADAIDLN